MYFGFCVRVLVVSLTFGQQSNAISERRGGSIGIKFDYPINHKLAFPSTVESSAQSEGFLGSSGSSHSAGGQVERYSPEGSVSSYGSNPNAKGVIQTKAGMWDYVSPENGKRFVSGIASSGGIVRKPGPRPPSEPKPSVYLSKPQQSRYPSSSVYPSKPQQPRYPSKPQQPVYPSKPQQPVYLSKPLQPRYPSKPLQPVYPSKPQQPVYPSKPLQPRYPSKPLQPRYPSKPLQPRYLSKSQQPRYPYSSKPQQAVYKPKPQQVGIQIQPGMSELFSPAGGVSGRNMPPINLNVQMTVPPRTRHIPMSSQQRPRWQHSMVPV